jgi:hypothetical protein
MKAYVLTTAIVFALLTIAHTWRAIEEGPHLLNEPWFLVVALAPLAFFIWAVVLLRRPGRP